MERRTIFSGGVLKTVLTSFACILAMGFCAGLAAQEPNSHEPRSGQSMPAAGPTSSFTDQQITETWGWILAHEKGIAGIEISQAELPVFMKGVAAGFRGQSVSYDLEKIYPDVERLARARREKLVRAITQKNEAQAQAFFAELDKNTNVVRLAGGIRGEIVKPGEGPYPKPEQTVTVHYVARLIDGTEFLEWGPVDIVLVVNKSLPFGSFPFPTWFDVLRRINKGGTIRFYVPPPLPEADVARAGIPPGSTMIFEVELLDLKDTSEENLELSRVPPAPEVGPSPPSGYSELQVLETWGWNVAHETHVANLGFGEAELSMLMTGVVAGVKGQPPPCDLQKIYPDVERFVSERREQARLAFQQKQIAATQSFFAELKKNTNVVKLASGLCYELLKPGRGPYPKIGSTVRINYVGRLLNGTVFDRAEDDEEARIPIRDDPPQWVIPGWTEGLQKVNTGGKIRLYVPYWLGYGEHANHNVPPYSTMIFDIDVLEIMDTPPAGSAPDAGNK